MTTSANIIVKVFAGNSVFNQGFTSEAQARAFIREELKWESTVRVECEALGINERGSFA